MAITVILTSYDTVLIDIDEFKTSVTYELTGGSKSSGIIGKGYDLIGYSLSGGNFDVTRVETIEGYSISGGVFDDYPVAPGYSTSGGTMALLYNLPTAGLSTSGGYNDLLYAFTSLAGGSNSSGSLEYALAGGLVSALTYLLNTETKRTYQFDNYQFNSFGRLEQVFMGVKADGLYDLSTTAYKDDSTPISAYLKFMTDYGSYAYKRVRGLINEGTDIKVTLYDEDDNVLTTVNLTADDFRGIPRNVRERWVKIKVENTMGQSIELRRLQGKINILERKGV